MAHSSNVSQPDEARWAQINANLFVGNKAAVDQSQVPEAVSLIIDLGCRGFKIKPEQEVIDYSLPAQELTPEEFPKTTAKLEELSVNLRQYQSMGHTIFICCADGKNKSLLLAGFFMISNGEKYAPVIDRLEHIYMTMEQRADEKADGAMAQDEKSVRKRAERKAARGLTFSTFQKILRLKGGAKR